jgi:hypothetical protein
MLYKATINWQTKREAIAKDSAEQVHRAIIILVNK